jgi:hypothetical protein
MKECLVYLLGLRHPAKLVVESDRDLRLQEPFLLLSGHCHTQNVSELISLVKF